MSTKAFKQTYVNELEKGRQIFGCAIALSVLIATVYNIWGVITPMEFSLIKIIAGHMVILTAGVFLGSAAELFYGVKISRQITAEIRKPYLRYLCQKTMVLALPIVIVFGAAILMITGYTGS